MALSAQTEHESTANAEREFDVASVRRDFPCLHQEVRGKPLVYLDTAATAQRPQCVIDAVSNFYSKYNASVHRGVHALGAKATDAFEEARQTMVRFVNAARPEEIVVTKGCTEGLNLAAQSLSSLILRRGDTILVSNLEHHSNIVPWQIAAERTGALVRPIPVSDACEIDLDAFAELLDLKPRIVALGHVSNAVGTVNPLRHMIRMAHDAGALVVVDGAQGGPHAVIDVQDLDADFYALAGHKMYGPTGVGALYGKHELLKAIPPYQGGGSMIASVSFEGTTYAEPPAKFEAGTPPIAEFIGLGVAANYMMEIGRAAIAQHEVAVAEYGRKLLSKIEGIRIVGEAKARCGILSFVMEGVHPHDVGTILDTEGIAVRAGHHCAQPLMERLGLSATARASLGMYSTMEEMDALAGGLDRVREVFG